MTGGDENHKLEKTRIQYAESLIQSYIDIIKRFCPDITSISHGTYDHYISLYKASNSLRIPVMVVNGGCNMAYIAKPRGNRGRSMHSKCFL